MKKEKTDCYWKEFHEALDGIGIGKGDILYVASDITRILVQARRELEIKDKTEQNEFIDRLIDELKKHITEEGTILFPVYSWAFCKGQKYDYYKTQGEVGALNNYVLNNRKDFKRTYHPIYSFMVWGKDSKMLLDMRNQDSWGVASPFEYLKVSGGKELDLSVTLLRSLTFKHYVEQAVGVPYRHFKYFLSEYIDENGNSEIKCFSMYVRDLAVKLESVQDLSFFIEKKAAQKTNFREWDISVLEFEKAYDIIAEDLRFNNGQNIYKFTDYNINWDIQGTVYEIGYLKDKELLK